MTKKLLAAMSLIMVAFILGRLSAQELQPTCDNCVASYVSAAEIQRYQQVSLSSGAIDQQVRSIDIGKSNTQVAYARRGALRERRNRVAEHDLVTEVYIVLSGSGTILTGPELINPIRRPSDNNAVMTLNGPGHNASDVRNGQVNQLQAGDVLVIPAGTGHEFTYIEDHISYLMVRVDPDKVVPLMNAADSQTYLASLGH